MVDAILAAGKVPVLPKIPYSTNDDVGSNVGYYNAMIDRLYDEYGDKIIHGPDFEEFFRNNTWGLSGDGVHPSSEGYDAMRKLWAETMVENVYSKVQSGDNPDIKGDVNNDGEFTVADAVLLSKWLHGAPDTYLDNPNAADLCSDNRLDIFDLVAARKLLVTENIVS